MLIVLLLCRNKRTAALVEMFKSEVIISFFRPHLAYIPAVTSAALAFDSRLEHFVVVP